MPVSGSKGYRSGIVTLPNRVRLREMDSRLGLYPTTTRTGDSDRKGNFNATPFDDTETISFNTNLQKIMYGSLSPSGSKDSLEPYAGNNNPFAGLSGVGSMLPGISDNTLMTDYKALSALKNDVEKYSPFNDERIHTVPTSFYLTGTQAAVYPGFKNSLYGKTQIVIDMSSKVPQDVGMFKKARANDPWPGAGDAEFQHFMAYYNKDLQKWDPLGMGLSHLAQTKNSHHVPDDMMASSSIGFGPIMQIATASNTGWTGGTSTLLSDALLNTYVRPVKTFGFPFAAKFHATGSNIIKMSDYISHPFVLEKLVWEFDAKIEKQSTSNDSSASESAKHNLFFSYGDKSNGQYRSEVEVKIFTFFMCRQFKGESKTISMDYFAHNGFDHTDLDEINNNKGNITFRTHDKISHDGTGSINVVDNRELITYSQLTQFSTSSALPGGNITINDLKNSSLARDSVVVFKRESGNGGHSVTGSFRIEAPCKITSKMTNIISALEIGNLSSFSSTEFGPDGSQPSANPARLYFGDDIGGRSLGELDTSARALVNGQPSLAGSVKVTLPSGQVTSLPTTAVVPLPESVEKTSPYILLPEDDIFLGFQYPVPFQYANAQVGSNAKAMPRVTFDGPARLVLYGSLIRGGKEYHNSHNQPLTSEAINESLIGNVITDQFQLATVNEYVGSYRENYVTASRVDPRPGSRVQNLITDTENVLSSSFQRFVKIHDTNKRYYDTLVPTLVDLWAVDGKKPIVDEGTFGRQVNILSFGRGKNSSGGTSSFIYNGSGTLDKFAEKNVYTDNWHAIFPFEKRYDSVGRTTRQNTLFGNVYYPIATASLYDSSNMIAKPSILGSFQGSDKSKAAHQSYLYEGKVYKDLIWGFGSDPQGYFRAVEGKDISNIDKTVTAATSGGGTANLSRYQNSVRLERARGWKYGLMCPYKISRSNIFRIDKFGQFSDMLEQSLDAREFIDEGSVTTQGPIDIKFVVEDEDGLNFTVLEESQIQNNTFESSNISLYATSSIPYFDDGVARNRNYTDTVSRIVEID